MYPYKPWRTMKVWKGKGIPEMDHEWTLADSMTALRILASGCLLVLPMGSMWFLAVYTLAGLTDALDGWVARKTGTSSEFGARLDSIADLLFYGILLFRLFPVLCRRLPGEIWYAVGAILLIRLMAYGIAAAKYHRFASLHTWLNKLTGGAIFLLPYVLSGPGGIGYSWGVCLIAFAASAEELAIHLFGNGYDAGRKTILGK